MRCSHSVPALASKVSHGVRNAARGKPLQAVQTSAGPIAMKRGVRHNRLYPGQEFGAMFTPRRP